LRAKGILSKDVTRALKSSWDDLKSHQDLLEKAMMANVPGKKLKALIKEVDPVVKQAKANLMAANKSKKSSAAAE
jgi:hypothetical protein